MVENKTDCEKGVYLKFFKIVSWQTRTLHCYAKTVKFVSNLIKHDSRILAISTEGDTDPVNFRRITWDGIFQNIKRGIKHAYR